MDSEPPLDGPGEESQLYCKPVAKKPKTAAAASSDDDSSVDPAPAPEPIDVDADDASDGDDLDRFGPRTEVDLRLGDAYASGVVVLAPDVLPADDAVEALLVHAGITSTSVVAVEDLGPV